MSKKPATVEHETAEAESAHAADLAALQAAADGAAVVPFMPASLKEALPALVRVVNRLQHDVDALKAKR